MAYIANTPDDVRVMLGTIGLDSLDQLFDMVPPEFRLKRALDVAPALTELELTSHISGLLASNQGADQRVCFLGAAATIISFRRSSITSPRGASSTRPTRPTSPRPARAPCRPPLSTRR